LSFALALLVACAAAPQDSTPAELEVAPVLRVMSFNLRYKGGDKAPHDWANRLPLAVEQIDLEHPDLVGTQEGIRSQLVDLERELEGYRWVGQGREGGSHGEYMAIFYKTERLELLEYDHYWLSDTPDVVGSKTWGNGVVRMTTWARFRERVSGEQFILVNTHFDHQVELARVKSAELMAERDKRFGKRRVIMTGDFNCAGGSSAAWQTLVKDGPYEDTWFSAKERGPSVDSFHGWGPPREGERRIDWILHRGPLEAISTKVCTYGRDGRWPSDHFPILAELRLAG
jgi:endonuclease/exonuclease/phosphatase family metal-dependent hydrolase